MLRRAGLLSTMLLGVSLCSMAHASSALDSPDNGVIQVGRGGAWLARADDPLAAYFNPAALVTQTHGVSAGLQLLFTSHCYDRLAASGERPSPGAGLAPAPDEVCADAMPFPNPHIGASFRLHQRFALGIAVLGPHAAGGEEWPDTIVYTDRAGETEHPSPQRYLLLEANNILLFPTLSGSLAITPELSIGAGFVWGIAVVDSTNMVEGISTQEPLGVDDFYAHADTWNRVDGVDGFIPGFVTSVLWSPHAHFDLSGWFRWSDDLKAKIDLQAKANYYRQGGAVDEEGANDPANFTDAEDAGRVRMPIPMEARVGFRYHHPRRNARSQDWINRVRGTVRDPLSQDVFDIELDVTWAHNSAIDTFEVRFEPDLRVNGTPGYAPRNADGVRNWRDTVGVRLGGDYVIIPDFIAARVGGFFESSAVDDAYLNLDAHPAERFGVACGGTVRLGPVDISLAYQHTFFGAIDNGGLGAVPAISGDLSTGNRSLQTVNGGKATARLDEIGLGVAYHF